MNVAVIDLGSNSTRLLIAEIRGSDGLVELERRSTVTRLAEGVDRTRNVGERAVERVMATLDGYARLIDRSHAGRTVVLATSAVRDARNGDDFARLVRKEFGWKINTLSGKAEAELTFKGATAGRPASVPTAVMDIGGGSTEVVVGTGTKVGFSTSVNLGAVRQTERYLTADPPSKKDLSRIADEAAQTLDAAIPASVRTSVREATAVAGTPTSLASIAQGLAAYAPEKVEGYELTLDAIGSMLGALAAKPLRERAKTVGLHPDRAYTIVAGTVILVEATKLLGLDSVTVSEHDLLYGAALGGYPD